MPKIIDAFIFFQELDLLDIRLAYLDKYVDLFVIVEACQTFSGKNKTFCFEENKARYAKYLDKIVYYKVTDSHQSFDSVIKHLQQSQISGSEKILTIMQSHTHYPKNGLRWVLDTYHRECIHLALEQCAQQDDIIIISDLDEIPHENIFLNDTLANLKQYPRVCRQHEFRYFLNFYNNSDWLGTIFAKFETIENTSLNSLRVDSKVIRKLVAKEPIENGGYHFTSCGGLDAIVKKIDSYAHQEFNNKLVLKNLEYNIKTGQDIFWREHGTKLRKISLDDEKFYDRRIAMIIQHHPQMMCNDEILTVHTNTFNLAWRKVINILQKIMTLTHTKANVINKFQHVLKRQC